MIYISDLDGTITATINRNTGWFNPDKWEFEISKYYEYFGYPELNNSYFNDIDTIDKIAKILKNNLIPVLKGETWIDYSILKHDKKPKKLKQIVKTLFKI